MPLTYNFEAELWLYSGEGAWYFITLPPEYAVELRQVNAQPRIGFGSIRVQARIGSTTWNTSLFLDKKSASYLLPVKKQVRIAEKIDAGDIVPVSVSIISEK